MASKKKKTGGRKKEGIVNFSQEQLKQIETLAGLGLTIDQVANVFGLHVRTLNRRAQDQKEITEAFHRGKAVAISNVAKTAYQMAVSGKVPAMTMFYLKCQARWKERVEVEHSGDPENPISISCVIKDYTR